MTKFRAVIGLNYPPPSIYRRLVGGEDIQQEERHEIRVEPGNIANNLPDELVPSLLEHGRIEEVPE